MGKPAPKDQEPPARFAVYVDAPIWPYRGMVMCHMFAERLEDLHAMADRIGVARRWFQNRPGFPHYDISKSKRRLAVQFGALEVDRQQFIQVLSRMRMGRTKPPRGTRRRLNTSSKGVPPSSS